MRLIRLQEDSLEFEFTPDEKDLFLVLLDLYPVVPASHNRLNKKTGLPDAAENQQLLEETLDSQRKENKRYLDTLVDEVSRFKKVEGGHGITFTRAEMENLLQVLNDIRVGSWIALGSPLQEQRARMLKEKKSLTYLMHMDLAGAFETYFLAAMNGDLPAAQPPGSGA